MTIQLAPTPTSSNARSAVGQTTRGTDYKQSINPDEIPARNATYVPPTPTFVAVSKSGDGLGLEIHRESGIEGDRDALQDRQRRRRPTGLETRDRRLTHPSQRSEFALTPTTLLAHGADLLPQFERQLSCGVRSFNS